jgi:quercetin dioxygenase-like cupin family protein
MTMLLPGQAHTLSANDGRIVDLGVMRMRVLAAGEETTGGAFTLFDCTGGAGAWTVPHLHEGMEESFFVVDGEFTFTLGEKEIPAGPGSYVLVPRGTKHAFAASAPGSRVVVLMVPGGLEGMFFELSELGADALRDPAARAAVAARYDSVPQ